MRKKNYLEIFFFLFLVFNLSGYKLNVFDKNIYKGETGKIKAGFSLDISGVDGMDIGEIGYKFDQKAYDNVNPSSLYLIPGEHIIEVSFRGQLYVTSPFNKNIHKTFFGYVPIKINIEANHEYIIKTKVGIYILDKTTMKRVGAFVFNEYQKKSPLREIRQVSNISLRSYHKSLSKNEVISMLEKNNFYDKFANKSGGGITHDYKLEKIQGRKVVIDKTTNLMWHWIGSKKNTESKSKVLKWIDKLNVKGYAGFNNWRLPTLEEAISLIESKKLFEWARTIDSVFSKTLKSTWTGDTYSDTKLKGRLYGVLFEKGGINWNWNYKCYILPVRSIK